MKADAQASGSPGFLRAITLLGLSASIFNCTVGGGIFRLPAGVAGLAGAQAPWIYVICALAIGCVVLCFAEAGSRVPLTGGPYAYVEVVFGRYPGFLAGALLWMTSTTAVAGVASACAENLAALIGRPGFATPILLGMYGLLALANVRGVKQGTLVVLIASVAKLLPLLVFVGVGAFFVDPENFTAEPPPAADLTRASLLLIFAFSGVESALVPSGEVKAPEKSVPRALALAMIGVTVLYLAIQIVAQGVLGADLAQATTAPLASAAERFLGPPGRTLLLVGATISMFGFVSGMILAAPRALWKFADEGILPKAVAAIHPRYHTPHVAIVVQVALVSGLALVQSFEDLAVISNLAALLLYAACAAATIVLRRRNVRAEGRAPFLLPGGPLVPLLTLGVVAWLLTSITAEEWGFVLGVLAAVSVLYALARRARAPRPRPVRV